MTLTGRCRTVGCCSSLIVLVSASTPIPLRVWAVFVVVSTSAHSVAAVRESLLCVCAAGLSLFPHWGFLEVFLGQFEGLGFRGCHRVSSNRGLVEAPETMALQVWLCKCVGIDVPTFLHATVLNICEPQHMDL